MRQLIDTGWDSRAWIVDGAWLDREPRRPEVADRLRAEVRLMRWLAPRLPLATPEPEIVQEEPLRVRHRLLVGEPIDPDQPTMGRVLGTLLRALHDAPVADAVRHGAQDADTSHRQLADEIDRMRRDVLPLLDGSLAEAGRWLLDSCAAPPTTASLVHGDLGPAHILVADGSVAGVIDWTDAHIGDPALDLAWLLNGTQPAFAAAVAAAYGADDELRRRSMAWHRLGPWHEVLYGFDTGDDGYIASGLAGVRRRLAYAPDV